MTALHSTADPARAANPDAALLRAAFRELHGPRLHGFALLASLGDRPAASLAASGALHQAGERLDELGHPERAAAWLRARALEALRRGRGTPPRLDEKAHRAALHPLGVALPVAHALAELSLIERAALIATDIERLDPRDVATVVKLSATASARLVRRAREAYLRAYVRGVGAGGPRTTPEGPLWLEIRGVVGRTVIPVEDHQ